MGDYIKFCFDSQANIIDSQANITALYFDIYKHVEEKCNTVIV